MSDNSGLITPDGSIISRKGEVLFSWKIKPDGAMFLFERFPERCTMDAEKYLMDSAFESLKGACRTAGFCLYNIVEVGKAADEYVSAHKTEMKVLLENRVSVDIKIQVKDYVTETEKIMTVAIHGKEPIRGS